MVASRSNTASAAKTAAKTTAKTASSGRGRGGPPALAHDLRRAPARQLLRLVSDHLRELTLQDVRQALRNPHVSREVIDEILLARHLLPIYEVRRALARHRRTSETAAMRFIAGLLWHDLLEISLDVQIRPAIRRLAEEYLVRRLSRLSVGEKMTLARRATGPVAARLRQDPSLKVIAALLENSRLTEEILAPMVAESTSPHVLDLLARTPRWGRRHEIRRALAKNGATPFRAALAILPTLPRRDLFEIAGDEAQSSVIRNRARDLLKPSERATPMAKENTETIDPFQEPEIDSGKL